MALFSGGELFGGELFGGELFGGFGADDFLDRCQVSEAEVSGDVFDGGFGELGFVAVREVGAGDLQSVEEDGGSFVVDVSGSYAAEDVVEGDLDGVAIVDGLHFEHADASGEGRVGQAGAVVVVAEVLASERGRAAAIAVGVYVAAEVAAGRVVGGGGVGLVRLGVHGVVGIPLGTLVLNYSGETGCECPRGGRLLSNRYPRWPDGVEVWGVERRRSIACAIDTSPFAMKPQRMGHPSWRTPVFGG